MQLLRLRPAFAGCDVAFVTVRDSYRQDVPGARFFLANDATRWNRLGLLRLAVRMFWILLRFRPDVVISTGAAPGYFALRIARLLGARTLWIDSIANVERISMSGVWVGSHVDLALTQWPHLGAGDGDRGTFRYRGAVL